MLAVFSVILHFKNALMLLIYHFNIKLIYKGKNVALIICSCGFCVSDGNHPKTDHHQSRNLGETGRRTGQDAGVSFVRRLTLRGATGQGSVSQWPAHTMIRATSPNRDCGVETVDNFLILLN